MEQVVIKIKELGFDISVAKGVVLLLENSKNKKESYKKMKEYLEKDDIKQHDIIAYAFELSNIKPEEYEIEE